MKLKITFKIPRLHCADIPGGCNRSDKDKQERAILEEKESLIENNTWKEVDISEAMKKKVPKKGCLFKDAIRYKARLVVKGLIQKESIDYKETFSR